MIQPKTIGVINNPYAGKGFQENAAQAQELLKHFTGASIITGPGEAGELICSSQFTDIEICPCNQLPSRAQTIELSRSITAHKIDLLVVFGGDGTLSDAAFALVDHPAPPPILGIGSGSTNVGPLITCRLEDFEKFSLKNLQVVGLNSLLVIDRGKLLGIGFNDCVFGFTVVGTIGHKMHNVDAAAKMHGENIPGLPRSVGTSKTCVKRITAEGDCQVIAQGEWSACIMLGFAETAFMGKAVTGGVCLASFTGVPAGCLVAGIPLVQVELTKAQVLESPPVRTQFLSFDANMRIVVSGVHDGSAICADGTPLKILTSEDEIEFAVRLNTFQSVKMKEG
jgi:NAD kinase